MAAKNAVRERHTLHHPRGLRPRDWLRFIQMSLFERCWKHLGLNDDDLRALEILVLAQPDAAPVIQGTGGVRKLRFSSDRWNFGKSGAARVYYLYVADKGIVFWLHIHMRDDEDLLSEQGTKKVRMMVQEIVDCLEHGC